jgi:hypothetical protein
MGLIRMRGSRDLSIEDRLVFYNRTIQLKRERGWGKHRIARELNLKKTTVSNWLRGHKPETRWVFPNLNPSKELSYILGVFYGDGSIYRANGTGMYRNSYAYRIQLGAIDKDFLREFNRCLSWVLHRKNEYPTHGPYKDGTCRLMATNRKLFEFLSKPLEEHKPIIEEFPSQFLRGFFDSEGSVYEYLGNNGWYQTIRVCNTNMPLLQFVRYLLVKYFSISSRLSTEHRKEKGWKDLYRVGIHRQESVVKFYEEIGFTIERKQKRLAEIVRRISDN